MSRSTPVAKFMLIAGVIAGSVDILLAFLSAYIGNGSSPEMVLRYVASGFFGKDAFSGGSQMIAWGLVFHFIIALAFTILFFYLYPRLKWMRENKVLTGIFYGLLVWAVMNLLVLPQSNVPPSPIRFPGALISMLILIIAIGMVLVYFADRYYRIRKKDGAA